jgi:hypothetical protein
MTGTTVMVKELGFNLDPNKKMFELNESGRTHGLKVDYENDEYDLYIYYQNKFFKTQFRYESTILKYFYSINLGKLIYVETINMISSDNSYIKIADGTVVDASEALDSETGEIKDGYITEAAYHEATIGPNIAALETAAIKRKFNIE